jgi:putative thioredoxin
MSSEHIIEVTEANFQADVIEYSENVPVVVDFWADWCQPCRLLSPLLEKLVNEANGAFRLAKVNADQNPKLVMQYNINSLPTVKGIRHGQVLAEFVGAQPELNVREFIRKLTPTPSSLAQEKGTSLLMQQRWEEAADSFREVLKGSPDDGVALLGLAKSLLAQGLTGNALVILQNFPAGKQLSAAEQLLPLAQAITWFNSNTVIDESDELEPVYRQAIRLVTIGNLEAAADGLLEILHKEKDYRNGEARQVILGVLEMMGDGEESRRYRSELASTLF